MSFGKLLSKDLQRSWRRLSGVALAVAASVGVLVLLGAVALGIERNVVRPMLPKLPLELLKVEPRTMSLGLFAVDTGDLGGGMKEETLQDLARMEGVTEVHGVVGTRVPLRAEGGEGFIGKRLRTDIFATGVPPALVADQVGKGEKFEDPGEEGPVPVIVARRLLDLYNTTVATALEKPRLSEAAVIGFEFQIQIGRSFSGGVADPSKVRVRTARIVGLSEQASLVGVTVPEATMRRWNSEFGKTSPLVGAWVRLDDPSRAGVVARRIEQRGLRVDDTPKLVGAALAVGAALVGLFGMLLLALSSFAIGQTFFLLVAERRTELAILRALGARRVVLARLVLVEAAVVGAVGACVGVLAGSGLALALEGAVQDALPELPIPLEHLVALPVSLLGAGFVLGVIAAVAGASFPALRAARAQPARALRT